ncbi:MAG: F0F1 ATP synthase subunit A [Cyanobacteria bacterium SIG30]|nr:F0F1 ATP synthase subunit A [Cyanobacteria bacterium SIG30]
MEHFIYKINGLSFHLDTIFTMWVCMGILILVAFLMTRKVGLIPSKGQIIAEKIVGVFLDLSETMIGPDGKKHVPLLVSLFLFILTANLSGQIPWRLYHLKTGELASPTNDINMTMAMAILVLVYYLYQGVKTKGLKYFLHSFSPADIITALIDLLEMVVRPFTLALRLFANILAGEILISAFIGICAYFLPLPIMFFEVFVAFIQALVFTLLSMSYIAISVQNEH